MMVDAVGVEPTMPEAEDLQSSGVTNFPTHPLIGLPLRVFTAPEGTRPPVFYNRDLTTTLRAFSLHYGKTCRRGAVLCYRRLRYAKLHQRIPHV